MNFLSWRNLSMIMLLGAAVALQGLALPARAAAVNLLTNGELTGSGSAPTGWMQWGEANHDAETALRRGSSGNAWKFWYEGGIFQDVTGGFTVGAKVYFGGYLYQASSDAMRNGNKNGRVEVEFRTSSDVLISTVAAQPILNASAPKDLWVLAAMSATVPANTGKIRLVIKIDSASSGAGMFYADDAFLETGGSLTAGNYYRRVNADIKAPNGNQNFFIRGMNLSGWIYPEAYMLQIPGGTYSQITAAVKNIMGSQSDSFWSTYQANQLSIGDLANFKSKGFNTVRVPFHYRTVCPQDNLGVLDFQKLDQITDWCEAQGLGVILDMHASPGGQSSDSTSDPNFDPVSGQRVAGLWTSTAGAQNQLRTVEIWKNLARHFRDRTVIVGYELLNEPELPAGTANSALWTFYQNAISAIRTSDPFHLIMVEGDREVNGRYTYDLEGFDRWDDNLSLAFHYYWQPLAASYLQVFLDVRSAKNLPLVMTESGENSNPWSFDAVKFFENPGNNVGWCWWGWKKVDNIAVAESAPMTPDYRWTAEHFYDASFPDITRGRLGLNQMAENLKTVNCAHDANYYLTLFDSGSVFNTARPYKSIALPGVIHASNYDEGNQGTGSFDSDYQAETYPPAWNHGSSGRNDGVDITRADDSCDANSNGYYLSWLAAGEWVRFSSVQVAQAGNYYLSYRVARPNNSAGAQFKIWVDGQVLATVDVAKTSGVDNTWDGFMTQGPAVPVYLAGGTHQVKFEVVAGAFNLAWVAFSNEQPAVSLLRNGELIGSEPDAAPKDWSAQGDNNHAPVTERNLGLWGNSWKFWYDGSVSQSIAGILPGDVLRFGACFYTPSADALRNGNKNGRMELEFLNGAGSLISKATAWPVINRTSAGNAWLPSRTLVTVPAQTASVRAVIRCDQPSSGDGIFYADDAYVEKIKVPALVPGPAQLAYGTFLGGNSEDHVQDTVVDAQGYIYLAGMTQSGNLTVTGDACQPAYGGGEDAFVAKLSPDGRTLLYCTYLGGSAQDYARGVAVDGEGNIYVAGATWSGNFPTTSQAYQRSLGGQRDAFVAKINPQGQLEYSSYLGGANWDYGFAVAVENEDQVYIGGFTHGSFPITAGAAQVNFGGCGDGFITKMNTATGALVYSTYLGGSYWECVSKLSVKNGVVYVAGGSQSPNFPTTANALKRVNSVPGPNQGGDATLTILNAAGSGFTYSTFLGTEESPKDSGFSGMMIDGDNNIVMVGRASESQWATTGNAAQRVYGGGANDGMIVKYNPAANTVTYRSYFGGNGDDTCTAIVKTTDGHWWVLGYTNSSNFPQGESGNGGYDIFAAFFDANGQWLGMKRFGGNGDDHFIGSDFVRGGLCPGSEAVCLGGATGSVNFPVTADAMQSVYAGGSYDGSLALVSKPASSAYFTPTATPTATSTPVPVWVPLLQNGALTGTGEAPINWAYWSGNNHGPDTTFARGGTGNAWRFWYEGGIFQDITGGFSAGDAFRFGGYFYTPGNDALRNGTKYGVMQAECRAANNALISTVSAEPVVNRYSAQSTWVWSGKQCTVPSGTAKIRLVVRCNDFTSGDGIFNVDDLYADKWSQVQGASNAGKDSMLPSATLTPTPSPSPTTTTTPTLQATSTSTPRAEIDFGNQQVLAFPNPAKDRVRFAWKAAQADFVKINIYSLTGERIAELSATPAGGNTLAWSTSGIAPGVYMYQVVLTVQGREERQGIRKLAVIK